MKTNETPKCPDCGAQMIERHSKKFNSDFWGCSTFPKCHGTRQLSENSRPTEPAKKITPSRYQVAIFQHVQNLKAGNLVVKATAGSGKTTTVEHASFLLPRNLDIAYVVYNAHVRDSAVDRMPAWVKVMTSHQLGLRAITDHLSRKPKVDGDKVYRIIKAQLDPTWEVDGWLISPVGKVVSLLKNLILEPSPESIAYIMDRYGIEANGSFDQIVRMAADILRISDKDLETVDFDDMLRFPVLYKMNCHKYDVLLLDEVQDFNLAQIELILRSIKADGRVVAVGDSDQSMYGFRGADTGAMQRVQEALEADILPLSITYRCPLSHVRLVSSIFPRIEFEPAPNAMEGELVSVSYDKMLGEVQDGDMVLCRTNAPLVKPAFALIRMGVKAVIRGRDIGEGLVNLIDKFKVSQVIELIERLSEYEDREIAKLLKANKNGQAQALTDRVETIFALAEGCTWVTQIKTKVQEVFSDEKVGVVFSTVHKAKGLESDNVYVMEPHNFPHPMAKKGWEVGQERNILFVALTRAKVRLAFVGPIPYGGEMMWDAVEEPEEVVEVVEAPSMHIDLKAEAISSSDEADASEGPSAEELEIPECAF